jgi:hypothetical protein
MTIRIVCENETGYDPTTGTFAYCDHTFTCDDSLLAKVTRCPKCQNSIRVGTSHRHVWADTGQPVADPNAVKQHARKLAERSSSNSGQPRNGNSATEKASPGAPNGSPAPNPKAAVSNKSNGNGHAKPGVSAPPVVANQATDGRREKSLAGPNPDRQAKPSGTGSVVAGGRTERPTPIRCYSCGTMLVEPQPKCPACLAELPIPAGLSGATLKLKTPVGFHRWLIATAFGGVPARFLAIAFHVVFGLFLGVIYGLTMMMAPREASIGISIAAAILALLYAYIAYACHRACSDLGYSLRWWQRAFWLWVLHFARKRQWSYDPADEENSRNILDLRGKNINDTTLVQQTNLTNGEVIDIAGCPVTDRGTKALHYLRSLKCLVLVGTPISKAEVARLQKSLPNCWIWH